MDRRHIAFFSVFCALALVTWSSATAQFATDMSDCRRLGAVPEVDSGQLGPGDGELEDPLAASLACRRAIQSEPDNIAAHFLLGRALLHLEDGEALHHLTLAADAGFVSADLYLGYIFETGFFGERDWKQSFDHYLPAATAGSLPAQAMVGFYYFQGYGVDHDAYFGLLWLRRAADAGNLDAKAFLGMKTIDGEVGYALGQRSSQQTTEEAAQMLLVHRLSQSRHSGNLILNTKQRVAPAHGESFVWIGALDAAEAGHAGAQLALGTFLQNDFHTPYFVDTKPEAAVHWLLQAVDEFPVARAELGLIYIRGEIVPKNVQLGLHYLCQAEEVGRTFYEQYVLDESPDLGEFSCDPS